MPADSSKFSTAFLAASTLEPALTFDEVALVTLGSSGARGCAFFGVSVAAVLIAGAI